VSCSTHSPFLTFTDEIHVATLRDKLNRLREALTPEPPRLPSIGISAEILIEDGLRPAEAASDDAAFGDHIRAFEGAEHKDERISRLRAQMELLRARKRTPDAIEVSTAARFRARDGEDDPAQAATPSTGSRTPESFLPGEVEDTAHGLVRRVFTVYDADHRHGTVPIGLALRAAARDLAVLALDPSLEQVDFSRALFIDTETTGLSGGAGTLPFLIGSAWFSDERLCVEQLLLERPGMEAPLLQRLAERLRAASCIVSYNGKSFDWPLLRTRFILNRVPAPPLVAHLDLLHCARRVYKPRLTQVRLVHLEEQVLGFTRVDDVAGEMIPETYLGYLRGRMPASALAPIVEHNRSDLLALPAILGELVRRFSVDHEQDVRDQFGFAQVAARAADHERAIALAERAAERDVRCLLAPQALYLSGQLALSRGELDSAIDAFVRSVEAAAQDEQRAAAAHLALAKLLEHKQKSYARALEHAKRTAPAEGDDACEKRVARLARRLAQTGSLR
jgi:uncharacterized protein YprB with RNaseH-like and TPR domain